MVANGRVKVNSKGMDKAVACLERGQFFGEVELMGDGNALANVQADGSPAEVAMLPKEHFYQIMQQSPETVELLKRVANERRAENLSRVGLEVAS